MNQRQYIIHLLQQNHRANPAEAITPNEIFSDLDAVGTALFKDVPSVSKTLDFLRSDGKVINGESLYKNGRGVLTWKIHPDFASAIDPEMDAIDPETSEPIEELAIAENEWDNQDPVKHQSSEVAVLLPDDPIDSVLIDLIKTYRSHKTAQPQPTLNNRSGKVAILRRLNDSALINPEFKPDLVELIDYIDQLAGAEQVSA
jgi:hypothetical protein